jgi:hypothetical protein
MTLSEIVEQLRWCGYTCEAGELERNTAFQELERLAVQEQEDEQLYEYLRVNSNFPRIADGE